jgi:O-antigen/teichoic acid export membrane protein
MFAVAGLGLLVVAFFNIFPALSVHLLFGSKYSEVSRYISQFAFATLFISLSVAFINFFVATRNKTFIYFLFIGLFFETVLLWYTQGEVGEYVRNVTISTFIIFVLMLGNYLYTNRRRV